MRATMVQRIVRCGTDSTSRWILRNWIDLSSCKVWYVAAVVGWGKIQAVAADTRCNFFFFIRWKLLHILVWAFCGGSDDIVVVVDVSVTRFSITFMMPIDFVHVLPNANFLYMGPLPSLPPVICSPINHCKFRCLECIFSKIACQTNCLSNSFILDHIHRHALWALLPCDISIFLIIL